MATIVTIAAGDLITNSRADLNTNFTNLNADKIESSYLDTDTALAANSDTKIPSQKAVKTYIDTSGGANASTTVRGIVEEATAAEVAALSATGATGARLFINPSNPSLGVVKSITAGATINGATLPVPVYQNKTDNEFYACDANDTAAMKYLGFAITNGTDGVSMTVKFTGIVSGFTGLDEGEKYYVQDAVGTIGTSPGTQEILVGIALSTTDLLIQKGRFVTSRLTTFASTTTTAITLGFRPSRVLIQATCASSDGIGQSFGGWTVNGANDCSYVSLVPTGDTEDANQSSSLAWRAFRDGAGSHGNSGSVTTITDTGFTLDNTLTGSGGTVYLFWTADGEL